MNRRVSILMYGHDAARLQYRSLVLQPEFDTVTVAITRERAIAVLETTHVDVLILCQTLPAHECNELLASAGARWPWAKVLVMDGAYPGCGTERSETVRVNPLDGPENLIWRVRAMLGTTLHVVRS